MHKDVPVQSAVILYEPTSADAPYVLVVPLGDDRARRHVGGYNCSTGAHSPQWRTLSKSACCLRLFIEFHALTTRAGIPARVVHQAFKAIPEYRQLIQEDIDGAESMGAELARVLETLL